MWFNTNSCSIDVLHSGREIPEITLQQKYSWNYIMFSWASQSIACVCYYKQLYAAQIFLYNSYKAVFDLDELEVNKN